MAGWGQQRIQFSNPEPGLLAPVQAVEHFVHAIDKLGPKPNARPLASDAIGAEGLDTSLAIVRWLAAPPNASTDVTDWLLANNLPVAKEGGPALIAGIVPFLDRLAHDLIRPIRLADTLRTALQVLRALGIEQAGILPQAWVNKDTELARKLASQGSVFTLCEPVQHKLADAGVPATIVADLLRTRGSALAPPAVRARVATSSADQRSLVEALGYEAVDVGPDPLPDSFSLGPEHRSMAEKRLVSAERQGAIALLVPGPVSLTRWAMLTRHGTWRSSHVLPVMPHGLAYLSITSTPLTARSIEKPLGGTFRQVAS
jgi:hypothetical protein